MHTKIVCTLQHTHGASTRPWHAYTHAGVPEGRWFCTSCLATFGSAGPPAWTAFEIGDMAVAVFDEDKPEAKVLNLLALLVHKYKY